MANQFRCAVTTLLVWSAASLACAQATKPHPWLPPFGLDRIGAVVPGTDEAHLPELEADAEAHAERLLNPIDLGAILVPHGWLLLESGQSADVEIAALARTSELADARLVAWYASDPTTKATQPLSLPLKEVVRSRLKVPAPVRSQERDLLHVAIENSTGESIWKEDIPVMRAKAADWPPFGATRTKLRYDAPISVRGEDNTYSTIDYDNAWDDELDDVVVSLPNGGRFVFWRGSSYVPFWAGEHNTGLSYEWAETTPPPDGFVDCVEPLMDKELRYGRVEIVESTTARVHVRWTYQSCDFKYKVWGDSAVEDFYFYPDGFGTRVLTLQSTLDSDYELSEFIILTPQDTFPFSVLPANLVDILFVDGEKRELRFPHNAQQAAKLESRDLPALYRVRLHKDERQSAIYFHPLEIQLPPVVFAPFQDAGQIVTPCYWGSHWPLARGQTTGGAINDRVHATPCHNSVMSWARQRPPTLRESSLKTIDTLGASKPMRIQTWAWLIGFSDAGDEQLLEWAHSFSAPPSVSLTGARLAGESYVPERRAIRLIAEQSKISVALTPDRVCVNPIFEIATTQDAVARLSRVSMDGNLLPTTSWAWDGHTLWVNATITRATELRLEFE